MNNYKNIDIFLKYNFNFFQNKGGVKKGKTFYNIKLKIISKKIIII